MKNARFAVGLDAGSARIRCLICLLEDGMVRYLAHADSPSAGWGAKGRLSDAAALTETIRRTVNEAERNAQASVDAVVVGIGGGTIEGTNCRGLYEFGRPREIDPNDLQYAVELASKVRLHEDRLLLQVAPQDFTVDGRAGFRNPRGTCSRLEANVHVITTSAPEHQALVSAVHHASLGVEETIFEPLAAAYASVLPEERSRGVAVIDIGAHSSDLVVYEGDALLRAASIPVCADYFTRDVAYGLTVSYEDAECLKREYGCAILGLTSDNSFIEVPSPAGRARREAPRRLLNEILEARAEELFLYIRNEIARVGMEQQLLEGIVLTGGGALLNGMCDMAEKVVNCPARNGLAIGIADWPDEINDPAWCVAAGLSMYSGKLKTRKEWKRNAPGMMGLVLR